jgi:hypothetical protein
MGFSRLTAGIALVAGSLVLSTALAGCSGNPDSIYAQAFGFQCSHHDNATARAVCANHGRGMVWNLLAAITVGPWQIPIASTGPITPKKSRARVVRVLAHREFNLARQGYLPPCLCLSFQGPALTFPDDALGRLWTAPVPP